MRFEQLLPARKLFLGVEPILPGDFPFLFSPAPNVDTTLLIALSSGDFNGDWLILDFFPWGYSLNLHELSWLWASLVVYLDWPLRLTMDKGVLSSM